MKKTSNTPEKHNGKPSMKRRDFIYRMAALPVTAHALSYDSFPNAADIDTVSSKKYDFSNAGEVKGNLPKGNIKGLELSRMFMGCNLIGGWAHSRDLRYVSQLARKYHTQEKVNETFALGEHCGMNAIILNPTLIPFITNYWKATNGKLKFISDCANMGTPEEGIRVSCDQGASACYIQGEITDKMLREGKSFEPVGEWIEQIRKRGVPAGIGAHSIEVIQGCVELGIKPDFWVKTLHHKDYWSAKHPQENDSIWCRKPEETIAFMNKLEEPWIAFKVMAAGAIPPKEGFKYAFEGGADFICVGMYDFQVVEDVNIALDVLSGEIKRTRPWRG